MPVCSLQIESDQLNNSNAFFGPVQDKSWTAIEVFIWEWILIMQIKNEN
jgi:hypothetical protein